MTKVEPLPAFDPAIGRFRLVDGKAVLERSIPLRAANGTPYNGAVNTQASTGEAIVDLNGKPLPASPNGYDSEGLVALRDGSFWVSDEYGPFITHFDRNGKQIERLSPFGEGLPAELAMRVPNKGMEGLTITPDGTTLVGMMQSALQTPDLTAKAANVTTLRIVTYGLKNHKVHEYLYLLTDPKKNAGAVSEITALSSTRFIVDERDGNFEPNAFKQLYAIDISKATDVGPASSVQRRPLRRGQGRPSRRTGLEEHRRVRLRRRHCRSDGGPRVGRDHAGRQADRRRPGCAADEARPDGRLLRARQGRGGGDDRRRQDPRGQQ